MKQAILYFLTRTPLHIGAGSSVGAIDQPIQRERHTGFPVIPATGQKGSFADQWPTGHERNARVKIDEATDSDGTKVKEFTLSDAAWLFGSDTTELSFAGALIFSEARVLAFPIRSARGGYAWITCPLMLRRAARDGVFGPELLLKPDGSGEINSVRQLASTFTEPSEDCAVFGTGANAKLDLGGKIVLEEYCFKAAEGATFPDKVAEAIADLVPGDAIFETVRERLVILSDGMMSHFAQAACEIAQHVRISDETGAADGGGLFNQENVPTDTLFYAVLQAEKSRVPQGEWKGKDESAAIEAFQTRVEEKKVFQFGGDATTGLGFCSVRVQQ